MNALAEPALTMFSSRWFQSTLYEEGVLVLFCVILIDRQLEAASISDYVTLDCVCGLKVPILGVSYLSAASTHRDQVVFFVCLFGGWGWGGLGGGGGYGGDEISSYPEH